MPGVPGDRLASGAALLRLESLALLGAFPDPLIAILEQKDSPIPAPMCRRAALDASLFERRSEGSPDLLRRTTYTYDAENRLTALQTGSTPRPTPMPGVRSTRSFRHDYWYLSDTLGSVRLLTDSTGASPTYAYAAFGSTAPHSSIANEVRFSGERTDTESVSSSCGPAPTTPLPALPPA